MLDGAAAAAQTGGIEVFSGVVGGAELRGFSGSGFSARGMQKSLQPIVKFLGACAEVTLASLLSSPEGLGAEASMPRLFKSSRKRNEAIARHSVVRLRNSASLRLR